MIRVYDTNALWRRDEIIRTRHMEAEIAARQEEMDRLKQEAYASEECSRRFKEWVGIIDKVIYP